jgi:hypothetical protein
VRARGAPREPALFPELSYDLEVDGEHGTVMRRAAIRHGKEVQSSEVRFVAYDEELDADLFDCGPSSLPSNRRRHAYGSGSERLDA